MGTRNLTIVIQDQKYKVVQYGQWDGYPTGQGLNLVEILEKTNLDVLKEKVSKLSVLTEEDISKKLKVDDYPEYHRDTATNIIRLIMLDKVYENKMELEIDDDGEPNYQEWNYIINLDTDMLEICGHSEASYPLNKLPDLAELKRLEGVDDEGDDYD